MSHEGQLTSDLMLPSCHLSNSAKYKVGTEVSVLLLVVSLRWNNRKPICAKETKRERSNTPRNNPYQELGERCGPVGSCNVSHRQQLGTAIFPSPSGEAWPAAAGNQMGLDVCQGLRKPAVRQDNVITAKKARMQLHLKVVECFIGLRAHDESFRERFCLGTVMNCV